MQIATSGAQLTTASYVDLAGSQLQAEYGRTFAYLIQCTLQDSKFKLMVSNDGTNWQILGSEGSIATDAQIKVSGDLHYQFIKLMIIKDSTVGGSITAQGITK